MEALFDAVRPSVFLSTVILILLMSLLPEPTRQRYNAIFVAGAGAAYLNGGFGLWEFPYILFASVLAYKGLESYKYIGFAWVSHKVLQSIFEGRKDYPVVSQLT